MALASLKKSENPATFTSQSMMTTVSWFLEAAAPFRQDMSSLSPCPHHSLLHDSRSSPFIHITCLN